MRHILLSYRRDRRPHRRGDGSPDRSADRLADDLRHVQGGGPGDGGEGCEGKGKAGGEVGGLGKY